MSSNVRSEMRIVSVRRPNGAASSPRARRPDALDLDARAEGRHLRQQRAVVARRFAQAHGDLAEDEFDPVHRRQDHGHVGLAGVGFVAQALDQGLGRMRQAFEPGQAEKTAGALDGVDDAEDVGEDAGVRRLALEAHELRADRLQLLRSFRKEILEKLFHRPLAAPVATSGRTGEPSARRVKER